MKPVVQEDRTGCAIASVAALAGVKYAASKKAALSLGIPVEDSSLWTATHPMRRLLAHFQLDAGEREKRFVSWDGLPDRALLAIKWHLEKTGPAWHWVVFVREGGAPRVLDSKRALRRHRRTDFGRMKPRWFIPIGPQREKAAVHLTIAH